MSRVFIVAYILCVGIATSLCLALSLSPASQHRIIATDPKSSSPTAFTTVAGDWSTAKLSLRDPKCCVVSVSGLEESLSTLQQYFCSTDEPPIDLDLRTRVRCGNNNEDDTSTTAYTDCARIYQSIMAPSFVKSFVDEFDADADLENNKNHPCILALETLARGVASLADGPLEGTCSDVHMRVVFASNYEAKDPPFHTDKCPLRGYVTLKGQGTQYMDRTCQPLEYAALRMLGVDGDDNYVKGLTTAKELEFIIMKGDCYDAPLPENVSPSLLGKIWKRESACVHRSPPTSARSKRRVILSLDLADGDDDQEWYELKKRGWRSGMTQRKSRLVA
eukprot:g6947.t1 g6947   contig23:1538426-1539427(+)